MGAQPLFYWNEKHAKTQPNVMDFTYQITAAKTVSPVPQGADSYVSFDAITQAQIDAYLGVASDFPATYFDSTSMGTDAFGGMVRMSGSPSVLAQGFQLLKMEAKVMSGTGFGTVSERGALGSTGMTASTLESACAMSTTGNFGFKLLVSGLDALTSGLIIVRLYWVSK
jgi:hypothetical protein